MKPKFSKQLRNIKDLNELVEHVQKITDDLVKLMEITPEVEFQTVRMNSGVGQVFGSQSTPLIGIEVIHTSGANISGTKIETTPRQELKLTLNMQPSQAEITVKLIKKAK